MRGIGSTATVLLTGVTLLLVSWGLFVAVVLPGNYRAGDTALGLGVALTAFGLGMRHAFDADHIAAIDNATRKLIGEGRNASAVGLWFALGHSTVVLAAVGLVSFGVSGLIGQIGDEDSALAGFTGVWGPAVSGSFLLLIAAVNLVALIGVLRRLRAGEQNEGFSGGLMYRLIAKFGRTIDRPWKMYVVGLLFGLGFDTASSITLMLLAGGAGIVMPWFAAMVFPLLFTAGMVCCDGLNSIAMSRAYQWTVDRPGRRASCNIVLISVSIAVAFLVGSVALSSVLVDWLAIQSGPLALLAGLDLSWFGFAVVGLMLALWAASLVMSRRTPRSSYA